MNYAEKRLQVFASASSGEQKAKSDGMKFYGLAVGRNSWMGYRYENAIQICDSQWQWIKGQCVNIESTPLIV